ncbi:Transposase [Nitrosococcus oceani ATCC 19707]|uniref:Transposase n=3 Tax=Nitrosococcus oceani TaxID=1229 RepID=Q3JAZ1_NITOC|nr:RNA-guided endonuclease TnpB family protein [Nitrosococcus oceani]ABA58005.1 Transposase [Nitrosococcus oceani ATCC 19707]GEM21036.1 transposase [Nitrosococcus oceani]
MTEPDSSKIQRSYKFRFYPTSVQRQQLAIEFGHARWVWNTCLTWRGHQYRVHDKCVSGVDFSRQLTFLKKLGAYGWLGEATRDCLMQKLRDQDTAFRNFFAGRAKHPKFKKRAHTQSIRYCFDHRHRGKIKAWMAGQLVLPKLGALKLKWSRRPQGIPKMVTVTQDGAGRYFISFMCEETIQPLPRKPNGIGVDLGVKDIVVTSEGWKSGNPRHLRTYRRLLTKTQRRLSRKVRGSDRWRRQRVRVAKAHARVSNTRQDWLHKLSTALIRQAGFIAMEDLNVRGMMANRRLSKALGDVGMHELKRQLEYKAKWYGREFVQVDRWAPTSKTCSACGTVQKAMPLNVREWTCPDCKSVHDRDINAARNILRLTTVGRTGSDARGGVYQPEVAYGC